MVLSASWIKSPLGMITDYYRNTCMLRSWYFGLQSFATAAVFFFFNIVLGKIIVGVTVDFRLTVMNYPMAVMSFCLLRDVLWTLDVLWVILPLLWAIHSRTKSWLRLNSGQRLSNTQSVFICFQRRYCSLNFVSLAYSGKPGVMGWQGSPHYFCVTRILYFSLPFKVSQREKYFVFMVVG